MQSLALLRAVYNACQRREMAVSTKKGLVNGPGHNLLMQFFHLVQLKNRYFQKLVFLIL